MKTTLLKSKWPFLAALCGGFVLSVAVCFGAHPAYLHARGDMWLALQYLQETPQTAPAQKEHLRYARDETQRAIDEVDKAIIIDGKPMNVRPPVDAHLDQQGRVHRAAELLRQARTDISGAESDPNAGQWRRAAYQHIDQALNSCKAAARAVGSDIQY
ncbi:MAG TPA: hypothetical protein VH351_19170 [Bryobacteraceae bacterium]|jgi:hypothetical protein|nr:hypothetical protein [Bryobacteraceae bacterium]